MLWQRVDELVDRSPGLSALRLHRLHLYAARVLRTRGLTVPPTLEDEVRFAKVTALAAPVLLERARAAYDGPLVLMKGPEAAARYPGPLDRYYRDLDLLTDDAPAAQRALIAAGFVELAAPVADQHLSPLRWPDLPLVIELHHHPHAPPWLPQVTAEHVLERTVPSATGIDGLLAPAPAAHALLLTVHSWAHVPLERLSHLVDIAAAVEETNGESVVELASAWGWRSVWRVTDRIVDAVLRGGPAPPGWLNIWTRHLSSARDRTMLEDHLARLAAPACAPPARAPAAVLAAVGRTARPRGDESWVEKLRRSRLALRHALMEKTAHELRDSRKPQVPPEGTHAPGPEGIAGSASPVGEIQDSGRASS